MATIGEVLHRLVDNSQAFSPAEKIDAHKAISEDVGETERHPTVPDPEAETASVDERAAKVAQLRLELAALDEPAEAPAEPVAEPVAELEAEPAS